MSSINRRSLNFDLDTKKLKEYYTKKNHKQAYKDIKKFLKANGFKYRKWSGYHSALELSDKKLMELVDSLYKQYTWFEKCVNKFEIINIGQIYDLKDYKLIEKEPEKELEPNTMTMEEWQVEIERHKKMNSKEKAKENSKEVELEKDSQENSR